MNTTISLSHRGYVVEGNGTPLQDSWPGKSHEWRSLEGCSPWGRWGSDTTERLHFHFSFSCIGEGNGNPLQCDCLENPRDRGACWAAIYGVPQSRTWLKRLSSSSSPLEANVPHPTETEMEVGSSFLRITPPGVDPRTLRKAFPGSWNCQKIFFNRFISQRGRENLKVIWSKRSQKREVWILE